MTRFDPTGQAPRAIVLASSSPYRYELMQRLGVSFTALAPPVHEDPLTGETPEALVRRLAKNKARSLATRFPGTLIIGSDQVAVMPDGKILNKPSDHAAARIQLQACSGRWVSFHTGLCLLDAGNGDIQEQVVTCEVFFRPLADAEIERYLLAEQPYDCAGSFKSERLGISLLRDMRVPDPSALIGLPLIALSEMLRRAGVPVP